MRITIHTKPNAKKAEITEISGRELKVSVPAPSTDGLANKKLVEMLSEYFDTPKSMIRIVSGHTGKTKIVEIL